MNKICALRGLRAFSFEKHATQQHALSVFCQNARSAALDPVFRLIVVSGHTVRFATSTSVDKVNDNNNNNNNNIESATTRGKWKDPASHRRFFDQAALALNIRNVDDWYRVKREEIEKLGGAGLLSRYYGCSLYKALLAVYPEVMWHPWRFSSVPTKFWSDAANHRRFFDWVASQLHIQKPSDWHRVKREDIQRLGGYGLLSNHYNNSIQKALTAIYPEIEWQPWQFDAVPNKYWNDVANQRKFFDWVGKQLGVQHPDDWYRVKREEIENLGGSGLLANYHGRSLVRALSSVYPEVEWLPWRFHQVPAGYWDDIKNQRRFFDWAAKQLSIAEPEDWYTVKREDIDRLGGSGLISNTYKNSLINALLTVYPEVHWQPWRFSTAPMGFWSDVENHRKVFEQLGRDLNVKQLDNWYNVKPSDIPSRYLRYYGSSLVRALQTIYPEHNWRPWEFKYSPLPAGSHSDHDTLRSYINAVSEKLCIRDLDEWHRISHADLRAVGGYSIIERNGGLYEVLKMLHPEHPWDYDYFHNGRGKKSSQRGLRVALSNLFPDLEIIEEYSHTELKFSNSGEKMQLDVFIPALSLAFEYQGEQHYSDVYFYGSQTRYKDRDEEKKAACRQLNITLVSIPYWWDRSLASLAATIRVARPDVSFGVAVPDANPIPQHPPQKFSEDTEIGSAPDAVMLAGTWQKGADPTGWWISEKLDGVRAVWNGKKLISRQGKEIKAPQRFIDGLPKHIPLDGELWLGRGKFQETVGAVKSATDSELWNSLQYWIFDVPTMNLEFESRMAALKGLSLPPHVRVMPMETCEGEDHLDRYLAEIVQGGGEGVVLRKPHSHYQLGRSSELLKFKLTEDAEVRFISKQKSNWGLLCEQPDGQRIVVQCSSQTYASKELAEGAILTVTHDGHWKSGKLRYPYFLRERTDGVTWDDVVRQFEASKMMKQRQHACLPTAEGSNPQVENAINSAPK